MMSVNLCDELLCLIEILACCPYGLPVPIARTGDIGTNETAVRVLNVEGRNGRPSHWSPGPNEETNSVFHLT